MKIKPIVGIITSKPLASMAGSYLILLESVMSICHEFFKSYPNSNSGLHRKNDLRALLARIDGVVLTGGRANIEPQHYGVKNFQSMSLLLDRTKLF